MQPRYYQKEAVDSVFSYLAEKRGFDAVTGQPKPENPLVAMPTGTGKAFVVALIVQRAMAMMPSTRIIMATHVKELVEQNAAELLKLWPVAPVGICSAGLRKSQTNMPITFGGIGTMINVVEQFGHIDIMIIDECHLLSPESASSYQRFIAELRKVNPYLRVIGLSATPWRTKQGSLTNEGIFTDIVYDNTEMQAFNRLIAEGYLCPLIARPTVAQIDLSGVGMSKGDYNQGELEKAVDKDEITHAALKELCEYGWQRRAWMIFASGKDHAEHCAEKLRSFGVSAQAVYSGIPNKERKAIIDKFKRGELRCIVNNNILTTGFNHPPLDLIGMLRPTMSTGLWVQMLGRGTRPYEGKSNCLVLDFAGNTRRLGPINDPVIPKRKKPGEPGEMPVKICNSCGIYNHTRAVVCDNCGAEFVFETKLTQTASNDALIRSDLPEVDWFPVDRVIYRMHSKQGKPPSLRVDYYSRLNHFTEFKSVESEKPYMVSKFQDWWRDRAGLMPPPPATVFEAIARKDELKIPRWVKIWTNKKPYMEVLSYSFEQEKPANGIPTHTTNKDYATAT